MKLSDYRKGLLSEHNLQVLLLRHLQLHAVQGAYWFAIPNAALRSVRLAARLKQEGMRAGVADICVMLAGGRTVWIEMKTVKGRQTGAQLEFQKVCEALGHPYILAHSVDEAIAALKPLGVLR